MFTIMLMLRNLSYERILFVGFLGVGLGVFLVFVFGVFYFVLGLGFVVFFFFVYKLQ